MGRKLDFLFCGSATDGFFSQIAFARLCLDALGGDYRDARVVAAFGEYDTPELPERWKRHYERIEVIWANPEGLPNEDYGLQHHARIAALRDDADLGIISDSDVCAIRPFDALLDSLIAEPAIAGVMAHYHFPLDGVRGDPAADWDRIARHVLGRGIDRPQRYLFGRAPDEPWIAEPENRPAAPFYLNYGVVIGTPALLKRLAAEERALTPKVAEITGPHWAPQIALALACDDLGLPVRALPPRYNYPNRPEAEVLYSEEVPEIALFHYMYKANFRSAKLFVFGRLFKEFLASRPGGADEIFRRHVAAVTGGRFLFKAPKPSGA